MFIVQLLFLCEKLGHLYSVRNFAKSSFSDITKFKTQGVETNGLNLFFANKGIVEQDLGHLSITSSSSHFFNNTDLKQVSL